jgi:hypothetical protein
MAHIAFTDHLEVGGMAPVIVFALGPVCDRNP